MVEHVHLDRPRLDECSIAYVARHVRLSLERMLDQMQLEFGRRVERSSADLALVDVPLVENVRRDVQLNLVLRRERLLALDALVGAAMFLDVQRQHYLVVELHAAGSALQFRDGRRVLLMIARFADVEASVARPSDQVLFGVERLQADTAGEHFRRLQLEMMSTVQLQLEHRR